MKSLLTIIGKLLFWLFWPVFFIAFYFTKRTRVLVHVDKEILVVKGWIDNNNWGLPGGGIHKGEDPKTSAVRELLEETGIKADPNQLKLIHAGRVHGRLQHSYVVFAYELKLNKKPELKLQKYEIAKAEWMDSQQLIDKGTVGATVKQLITIWQQKN